MYSQVIFYNHFGNGDIFESREFVKEWMRLVPAKHYMYAHGKNPRILLDIDGLEFKEVTIHMKPMRGVWDDLNGNLYVNTWIGRDGKYVLPGIGCTVEKLYNMHNDMLKVYGLGSLRGNPIDYIPSIDYSKYNINTIKETLGKSDRRFVYIDNGLVQSRQAHNFEFNPIIEAVAGNHKDISFILTHKFPTINDNVLFTSSYTESVGFDLNEVSFISLYCDTLIGRNSGPHVFTQVKENVDNPQKKLLSFTYTQQGSSFVVNTNVKIQKFWSSATEKNKVIGEIERILG